MNEQKTQSASRPAKPPPKNMLTRFTIPPITLGSPTGHTIAAKTKNTITVLRRPTKPFSHPPTFYNAFFIVFLLIVLLNLGVIINS